MTPQVILKYPAALAAGFITAYVLTILLRQMAPRIGLLDMPGERRIHTTPVPIVGGIAIFFAVHACCAVIFLAPWKYFEGTLDVGWWIRFAITSSALLVLGIVDDIRNIRPLTKLAGQFAVAAMAFFLNIRVGNILGFQIPPMLDFVFTTFWFLAIINAFNLIDGMDGVATGLAAIATVGMGGAMLFQHQPGDALIMLGLLGACLAFLRFNFHPARCFLGDAGSMFLGFTLAAIALDTGSKSTAVASIGMPLLAVGVPLFDEILAVWRRSVRRVLENGNGNSNSHVFNRDLDHLHHRLSRMGLSQRGVAMWLYAAGTTLVGLGLLLMVHNTYTVGIFLIAFVLGVFVIVKRLARIELWASGRAIAQGLSRPSLRTIGVVAYPVYDALALIAAFGIATYLSNPTAVRAGFKLLWFDQIPVWVGTPLIAMMLTHTYSRVWNHARASDYALLIFSLTSGVLLAMGISTATGLPCPQHTGLHIVVYAGLGAPLLMGLRAFPRLIHDGVAILQCDQGAQTNVLIYGAGDRSSLLLRTMNVAALEEPAHRQQVVGVVDDDNSLRGRLFYGCPILGGIDNISEIIQERNVNEIVVTTWLKEEVRSRLVDIANQHGISVSEWTTELRAVI